MDVHSFRWTNYILPQFKSAYNVDALKLWIILFSAILGCNFSANLLRPSSCSLFTCSSPHLVLRYSSSHPHLQALSSSHHQCLGSIRGIPVPLSIISLEYNEIFMGPNHQTLTFFTVIVHLTIKYYCSLRITFLLIKITYTTYTFFKACDSKN